MRINILSKGAMLACFLLQLETVFFPRQQNCMACISDRFLRGKKRKRGDAYHANTQVKAEHKNTCQLTRSSSGKV